MLSSPSRVSLLPGSEPQPSILKSVAEGGPATEFVGESPMLMPLIGYKHNLLPLRTRGGDVKEVIKAIDFHEV